MNKFWINILGKGRFRFQDKTALETKEAIVDLQEDSLKAVQDVPKDDADTDYYTFEKQ